MADKKITDLDPITTVQPTTLLLVVDMSGTPINKKATVNQLPLPANVPLLDAANNFTNPNGNTFGTVIYLHSPTAPTDQKDWGVLSAGPDLSIYPLNDAHSAYRAGNVTIAGGLSNLSAPTFSADSAGAIAPVLVLNDGGQPVDQRKFRFINSSQVLTIQAVNDALNTSPGQVTLQRNGVFTAAAGLGATPLNAANLSSGVVPDARLGTSGTWTPTLVGNTTPGNHGYATQVGHYFKIGRLVFCNFNLAVTTKDGATAGQYLLLGGLPFPIASDGGMSSGVASYWGALSVAYTNIAFQLQGGMTMSYLWATTGGVVGYMAPANLINGSYMAGSLTYLTT